MKILSSQQLWNTDPDTFNEWRQRNDIPQLLDFFKKSLPFFKEWLAEFEIDDSTFVTAPHTGEWFIGKNKLFYVEYTDNDKRKKIITDDFDKKMDFLKKHREIEEINRIGFIPYIQWGANKCGKTKFILVDKNNKSYSNTLQYGLWSSSQDGSNSRASLLKKHQVLKLGQITVPDRVDLSQRNLDFVDLDFISINGEYHGSHATSINFSSCRNFELLDASMHHVTFFECVTENFRSIKSRLQDFVFISCALHRPEIRDSFINGFEVRDGQLSSPIIERTEIQRFEYFPSIETISYPREVDVSRRIRNTFQSIGKRHEARKFYYRERCFERKALWSPYIERRKEFPKRKYTGKLRQLIDYWKDGHFDSKKTLELLLDLLLFHVKIWTLPRYLYKTIKYKAKYFFSLFEYMLWGYGERPVRIVINMLVIISLFCAVYYQYGPTQSSIVDSLYFSIVTFTTLGYGDIQPNSEYIKLACGTEALLGAISIGVLIGGFANRSKY